VERDGRLKMTVGPGRLVGLTKGETYEVIAVEGGWYRLIDDSGEDYLYPRHLFEVVDEPMGGVGGVPKGVAG